MTVGVVPRKSRWTARQRQIFTLALVGGVLGGAIAAALLAANACTPASVACRYMDQVAPWVKENLVWALAAIGMGFVLGFFLGWGRVSRLRIVRAVSRAYTELIRGTPLLIQILGVFYFFPAMNSVFETQGIGFRFELDDAQRIVIALVMNTSAYQAEIFRAGFQSIAAGQVEAATSIGMTRIQAMRYVILPQALRITTPPLTNEYVIMFKDATPLAFVVAVPELVRRSVQFGQTNAAVLETYLLTAAIFLSISLVFAGVLRVLERRFSIPGLGIHVRAAG